MTKHFRLVKQAPVGKKGKSDKKISVVLKKSIRRLGQAGEVVRVQRGYFRNYLGPQEWALYATPEILEEIEKNKHLLQEEDASKKVAAEAVAKKVSNLVLEFKTEASESGVLFGSVTASDVRNQLQDKGIEVSKSQITLQHIKAVGEYIAYLEFHSQVVSEMKVIVSRLTHSQD
jgi:large subunit ribosomal protein L9